MTNYAPRTDNGFPRPGHITDNMQRGLGKNGVPPCQEAAQSAQANGSVADPVASGGGRHFMKRVEEAAARSPRFRKRNALNFDGDRTAELGHAAAGGQVRRARHIDNPGLGKRLEGHRGRVIIRNPDGTTKYMFERQDANGNFDPNGEWCGFDAFGNAMNPASPAKMIEHMVNTAPAGLHFSSYYLDPISGDETEPLDFDTGRNWDDVGLTMSGATDNRFKNSGFMSHHGDDLSPFGDTPFETRSML